MTDRVRRWPERVRHCTFFGAVLLSLGCSSDEKPAEATGPFKSVNVAANDPASFTQPLAGVPLPENRTAVLAFQPAASDDVAPMPAIFVAEADGSIGLLHAGAPLVAPFDIDLSFDGTQLLVADRSAGEQGLGSILAFSLADGAATPMHSDYGPVSVTVASDGNVYFSGQDPELGVPGVFRIDTGGALTTVFAGTPLVDPSGITIFGDGRVLVADTRLSDDNELDSEAGVVLIENGAASIFVSGMRTGYPAGIALTVDEKTLIISAQGSDDRDKVYLVDVASRAVSVVEAEFSVEQLSSGGLKRDRATNRFVWASGSHNGGTVYTIEG